MLSNLKGYKDALFYGIIFQPKGGRYCLNPLQERRHLIVMFPVCGVNHRSALLEIREKLVFNAN
ncbi:hypothetical protein B1F79_04555, partial [Coxiella-like endosymbiont of Rhipicephalus sanguineus]|nr:hypothetical protein [Coxiella-like endosymbiont of Rhipicephalus sanguineus]